MLLKVIAIVIGGFFVVKACSSDSTTTARDAASGGQETMAFVMCQRPVTNQLRAPSSADFPTLAQSGVSSSHKGGGVYAVSAYVDAQNGFGAKIRTHWECEIKENQDKTWSLVDLKIIQ